MDKYYPSAMGLMVCKGINGLQNINANGKGVDGLSCFWLPHLTPASGTSTHCLHPSFETKTRPARTPSEEQGNSIGFLGENNVGGTQTSTGTSASALQ